MQAFLVVKDSGVGGVKIALWHLTDCGAHNFHPTATKSILYENCDVLLSFDTLVRSLRPIVWPQRLHKVTDGKARKIVENHS